MSILIICLILANFMEIIKTYIEGLFKKQEKCNREITKQ